MPSRNHDDGDSTLRGWLEKWPWRLREGPSATGDTLAERAFGEICSSIMLPPSADGLYFDSIKKCLRPARRKPGSVPPLPPVSTWWVREIDWHGKKPPPSLFKRFPEALVKQLFKDLVPRTPGSGYRDQEVRWPYRYSGLQGAVQRHQTYEKSYYSIRLLLKNAYEEHDFKCRQCYQRFARWTPEGKKAFNYAYTRWWDIRMKLLIAFRKTRDDSLFQRYINMRYAQPDRLCSLTCRIHEQRREKNMKRAMNLRHMFHDWACGMFAELLDTAREYQRTEGRKIRELNVMIRACNKLLREKQREADTEFNKGLETNEYDYDEIGQLGVKTRDVELAPSEEQDKDS